MALSQLATRERGRKGEGNRQLHYYCTEDESLLDSDGVCKKEKKKKIVAGYGSLKRNNAFASFCWKKDFFSKKLVPHLIHKIAV
jgi:hypothetical protein